MSALSGRRDMFLDERGTGLRVTWHPERDLVVLSVWQGDRCVGTFRMSVQDIPRLSGLLAAALGDWVDQGAAVADPGGPTSDLGSRITGEWELGDPGKVGSGATASGGAEPGGGAGAGGGPLAGGGAGARGGSVAGLSVQQRIRLSRTMLKLRGIQRRRRSD